jgi:uroporphyrinogen-III synthase
VTARGAREVWITRARPGAEVTAARVRERGFEPVVAPLLAVRAVGEGPIDLAGVGAIAFTSANAVAAFAARSNDRGLPVFAVGTATAAAAAAAGFAVALSADRDVGDLAAAIAARTARLNGAVLHPAAAQPAGDLAGELARRGIAARTVTVYETVTAKLSAAVRTHIAGFHAVLVHSPKAARRLASILHRAPAPALRVCCLSPAVAAPLRRLALPRLQAAALPNEDALLNLILD